MVKNTQWALIKKAAATAPVTKTFGKKNQTRVVAKKFSTRNLVLQKTGSKKQTQTKLRASITPGTVLILLAGRFAGKRVVFLKQLESGLLLVSGPYKVNGVPLKRVNQAYVIATTTKVDVSGVNVDNVTDALWKKTKSSNDKTEKNFFKDGEKKVLPQEFVTLQQGVDAQISSAVEKTPFLKEYLANTFSLSNGVYPHALKF